MNQRVRAARLRVVIATSPQSGSGADINLGHEVQLAKAAVLYADQVDLVSPGVEILGNLAAFAQGDERNMVQILTSLDEETLSHLGGGSDLPANWRDALPLMTMDEDEWSAFESLTGQTVPVEIRQASAEFREALASGMGEFRNSINGMVELSGAEQLSPALDAGLIRISPTFMTHEFSDSNELVERYVDQLRLLLKDPSVHLLLDETMASLVRAMIAEGQVSPGTLTVANSAEAAVGSGLIARLPAFDVAPMDELLNLRSDLENPLSRYRRAVAQMGGRLRVGPFDEALSADIDHLYRTEIDPALADLREGMADHSLVREVARQVGSDVKAIVTGATGSLVSVGVTSLAQLSGWVTLAGAAVSAAGGLASPATRAIVERQSRLTELRGSDLYYLFELDRVRPT